MAIIIIKFLHHHNETLHDINGHQFNRFVFGLFTFLLYNVPFHCRLWLSKESTAEINVNTGSAPSTEPACSLSRLWNKHNHMEFHVFNIISDTCAFPVSSWFHSWSYTLRCFQADYTLHSLKIAALTLYFLNKTL